MKIIITTLGLKILSLGLQAQVLGTKNISLEAAKKISAEAVRYARSINAPGASIAIVDAGGNLLYMERLDNTFPASAMVAYEKARTAATFKAASSKLENAINGGRQALITVGHTFLQGGIPVVFEGQVIGAIGVSGSASAQQDEDMAIAGSKVKIEP